MNASSSWSTRQPRDGQSCGGTRRKRKKAKPLRNRAAANGLKLTILKSSTGREIEAHYELGRELDRSEFRITYLCTNKELGISYGCH
ncbi:hypothetical protein GYH30_052530 [Glycine max]|nr:hypothetical protein GYH30_052530 [Glycine max]